MSDKISLCLLRTLFVDKDAVYKLATKTESELVPWAFGTAKIGQLCGIAASCCSIFGAKLAVDGGAHRCSRTTAALTA